MEIEVDTKNIAKISISLEGEKLRIGCMGYPTNVETKVYNTLDPEIFLNAVKDLDENRKRNILNILNSRKGF